MNTTTPSSILTNTAHPRMSQKYGFVPTHEIVRSFNEDGWKLTSANEVKVRKPERAGFQKHLLRFTHESQLALPGERIETLFINAHDGTSSVQIGSGIFRFACANGLVVADSTLAAIRLGHHKLSMDTVLHAAHTVLAQANKVQQTIENWKTIDLTDEECYHIAQAGISLRWGDNPEQIPVTPELVVQPRRMADLRNNLWNVFNRVQENVIRGGQVDYHRRNSRNQFFRAPRSVKALSEDVRINRGLWEIASDIALHA
jgi:hypothetical protein